VKELKTSLLETFSHWAESTRFPLCEGVMKITVSTMTGEKRSFHLEKNSNDVWEWASTRADKKPPQNSRTLDERREDTACQTGRTATSQRSAQKILSAAGGDVRGSGVNGVRHILDKAMAELIEIHQIDGCDAAWIDPIELLTVILTFLDLPPGIRILTLCLTGDGRLSGHKSTFTLSLKICLPGNEKDQSTKWLIPLAAARGKETYANLAIIMRELGPRLKHLKKHVFTGQIPVQLRFCSDGKFLLTMLGMKSAKGAQSCPFCLLPADLWAQALCGKQFPSLYLRKSMEDLTTLRDNCFSCPLHTTTRGCHGSSHGKKRDNLLEGIVELEDIIIDELHFFLRMFELLLDLLLRYVEEWHLEGHFEDICSSIPGVSFYESDGMTQEGWAAWSPLDGGMMYLMLCGFLKVDSKGDTKLSKVFYVGNRAKIITRRARFHRKYFKGMLEAFTGLKQVIDYFRLKTDSEIQTDDELELTCDRFSDDLVKTFGAQIAAQKWYLHVIHSHIPAILKEVGSIFQFSCTPAERVNGSDTRTILCSCLQTDSSHQLMQTKLREIHFSYIEPRDHSETHYYPAHRKAARPPQNQYKRLRDLDHQTGVTTPKRKRRKLPELAAHKSKPKSTPPLVLRADLFKSFDPEEEEEEEEEEEQ
jgi:hypothetical protein